MRARTKVEVKAEEEATALGEIWVRCRQLVLLQQWYVARWGRGVATADGLGIRLGLGFRAMVGVRFRVRL